jgi:hypothetical protein
MRAIDISDFGRGGEEEGHQESRKQAGKQEASCFRQLSSAKCLAHTVTTRVKEPAGGKERCMDRREGSKGCRRSPRVSVVNLLC